MTAVSTILWMPCEGSRPCCPPVPLGSWRRPLPFHDFAFSRPPSALPHRRLFGSLNESRPCVHNQPYLGPTIYAASALHRPCSLMAST